MRWTVKGNSIEVHTPAKLNLFLEVLGKRADGFHELETVITAIDRFDTFTIRREQTTEASDANRIEVSCRWSDQLESARAFPGSESAFGDLPNNQSNIVYRAAELFARTVGSTDRLNIELVKTIPSMAGLGGASGNAAGTLIGLNELWGGPLSTHELLELAAQLGSDVPFFIQGGTAACRGRGEKIELLDSFPKLSFVVVRPPFGLATPDVFSRFQLPNDQTLRTAQEFYSNDDADSGNPAELNWNHRLLNRLQSGAEKLRPEIKKICLKLNELGCSASQMTGSGSSCFGICHNLNHAQEIAGKIEELALGLTFTCQNLPNFPVPFPRKPIG